MLKMIWRENLVLIFFLFIFSLRSQPPPSHFFCLFCFMYSHLWLLFSPATVFQQKHPYPFRGFYTLNIVAFASRQFLDLFQITLSYTEWTIPETFF